MIRFPNGYIIETGQDENAFYVYGELNDTGSVAKGFRLLVPNLSHSGWGQKNDLYCNLQAYLSRFDGTKRIQFRYRRDSNYRHILDRYDADTRKFSDFPFARKFRERIAARFRKEMENQELRREYLSVYIACPAKNFISGALNVHSEKAMRQFKMRVSEFFESEYIALKSAFDFPVEKMTALELFAEFYGAVNSSLSAAEVDYRKIFTPNFSEIYCNEYSSQDHLAKDRKTQDASGRGYGLYGDGMYHNILSMRQLPSFDLTPFYGNIILESNVSNFSVTTNLKPLNKSKAIEKLEARQAAAQRDLEADPSAIAYRSEVDALGKTIYRMGAGEDIPFEAEYLIHVWNPDLDQLRQDTELLRLVATNLQCHMMMYDLTVQSEAEFLKTLPGNLYYKKWSPMFVLHRSFAAILPFSSTFVGCEQEFQALFHGDHNNLVCVNGFYGGTPQHAAVFGQTGSGKSVNILGELLQTFPYYHKLVIIEEGASYLMFTRIFGGEFIEIDLNNNMTLNYFDTCAAPLTANQIDFATSFATAMCGQSADDELIQDRTALLSHYIIRLYDTAWQEWWSRHTELRSKIARLALTVEWMLPHQTAGRNTLMDCYADIQEAIRKTPSQWSAFERNIISYQQEITDDMITECIVENGTLLRDISFAYMKPEDMPYHSQLVEMIRSTPDPSHRHEDTDRIATRLAQYAVESGRGALFDGVTNINLKARLLHFELGKLANASQNIRAMVGLVISNFAQQQIINMPRKLRKMFIFEEMPRIIATIPNAGSFAKQAYAQLRKHGCRALTITQEAGQLQVQDKDGSDLGTVIMSQSKQYYFLRNRDKDNIDYFRRFVNLSEDTVDSIMRFPAPEHLHGKKYSSFVYYADAGEYPLVGVIRHYADPLTIAVASTTGEAFTQREEELRKLRILYPDLDEGELLLEYQKRQSLDNPALRLIQNIIAEKDYGKLELLQEEIIKLSHSNNKGNF